MNTDTAITVKPAKTARGLADNLASAIEDAGKDQARKAKNAERARARRARAKAISAEMAAALNDDDRTEAIPATINPSEWQTVVVNGVDVKVAAHLSPEEAEKMARKLMNAKTDVAEAKAADAPEAPKSPKPVKLKGDPLATVFYRLSRTAMEALEGKPGAEYRKANPKDWKVLKASKKITGGQSWAFTGNLRPEAASTLAAALRTIAASEGFAKPGSLITNAAKLESNHYVTKAAEKR